MLIGVGTCTVNIGVQPISFDTASLIVECMYFFGVKGLQTGPSSCSTPHSLNHALPFKTCRLWYNTKIQIKAAAAALYITIAKSSSPSFISWCVTFSCRSERKRGSINMYDDNDDAAPLLMMDKDNGVHTYQQPLACMLVRDTFSC